MSVVIPAFEAPVKAAFFGSDAKRDYNHITAHFGLHEQDMAFVKQEHTNICHIVSSGYETQIGDALVTIEKNKLLAVITADCAPVLFTDGHVIAAAHAGWKGTVYGVLENTIAKMKEMGAGNIRAVIGPCIGPQSYEVSPDFLAPFMADDKKAAQFFRPQGEKYLFNLPAYVIFRLQRAGVQDASWVGQDTYKQEDLYYSYRRATQRGEPSTGRQVSAIGIF
ncbi:MAG: peptidoglycan editing factor PgeF [Alphaproteobacteria bacterium]|nr:peptidoglycan editing factor PgeF [Alphaproteobacteria bacterium]